MSKLPLLEGLLNYSKEGNCYFCMPGHKAGKGFLTTDIGKQFISKIQELDITEVEGLDNLHNAEGIIKESQDLLSKFYGSQNSYFLVNGSTSGNLAMIFSSFEEGDKVIVERNCHRSIFNGIIMRKLKPVYIKNKINEKFNAPLSIDMEHFLYTLKENKDAKGIIVTYPNYYGVCCDLKSIINEANKYGMKVLVDSAHGAHFGVTENLPPHAVKLGANMVVMSSHKTLPSFTQTAYLHVDENIDKRKLEFYVSAFLSTSPSYMLMASMDYARYYLEERGKEDYHKLINICNEYRHKINNLHKGFYVLGREDLLSGEDMDSTRYVINLKKQYSGHKLLSYLRNENIQCEMSDGQNVVLIFSPFNDEKDFLNLYTTLKECPMDVLVDKYKEIKSVDIPKMAMKPYEVMEHLKENIKIGQSLEKICAKAIVPYPPGVPVVMPGEIITKEALDVIKYNLKNDVQVMGVDKESMEIEVINF